MPHQTSTLSGWDALEEHVAYAGPGQRSSTVNSLLAQTLRDYSSVEAFAKWNETLRTASPGQATNILRMLPVCRRSDLAENLDNFLVGRDGPKRTAKTSGSSGRALELARTDYEGDIERCFVEYAWSRMGVPPGSKGAVLLTNRRLDNDDHQVSDGMLWISSSATTPSSWRRISELLSRHQVTYVRGFGSVVGEYFSHLHHSGTEVPPSIQAVAYSSDPMLPAHRNAIGDLLGKSPVGLYGQSERAVMGVSCEHTDNFHMFETYGFAEILDDDNNPIQEPGREGRIVGTSLWPRETAILRYDTGDRGTWVDGPCPCGRTGPLLQLVENRTRDYVYDADGKAFAFVSRVYGPIRRIAGPERFVQFAHPNPGSLVVRLEDSSPSQQERIRESLLNSLGKRFEIALVDEPAVRTSAGKRLLLDMPARMSAGPASRRL